MRIKKTFQGNLPENTVVNTQSNSQINAYSCEYANNNFKSKMENILSSQGRSSSISKSLTKAYTNFDFLIIVWSPWDTDGSIYSVVMPTSVISSGINYEANAFQSTSVYKFISIQFPSTTSIKVDCQNTSTWNANTTTLIGVYGVKL